MINYLGRAEFFLDHNTGLSDNVHVYSAIHPVRRTKLWRTVTCCPQN